MSQDKQKLEINPEGFLPPEARQNELPNPSSFESTLGLRDLGELIRTVSAQPTYIPKRFTEQIVVEVAGGAATLYVFDVANNKWRGATLGT